MHMYNCIEYSVPSQKYDTFPNQFFILQANSQSVMPDTGVSLGLGNIEDVMDDDNILSGLHDDFKMDNDINDGFLFNVFEEITNSPNTLLPGGNNSNPGSPTDNGRHSLSAMNGSTSVSL